MAFCNVDREGPLLIVTMNAPDRLNAFPPGANDEMANIFDDYEADPSAHVAVLSGAGRAFCSGSDIKAFDAGYQVVLPPSGGAGLTHRQMDKPLIGAVPDLAPA